MQGETKLADAVSAFGAAAKQKLSNKAAVGAPEDQLRSPLETLVIDLAEAGGLPRDTVTLVGETTLSEIRTRPDFAVTRQNALIGFIEVKAPGKASPVALRARISDRCVFDFQLGTSVADSSQSDLFGNDQGELFAPQAPINYRPEPAKVRAKLLAVLDRARAAPTTAWSRKDMEYYRVVFPQMTNWLPDDEARQLCFEFDAEIERLLAA